MGIQFVLDVDIILKVSKRSILVVAQILQIGICRIPLTLLKANEIYMNKEFWKPGEYPINIVDTRKQPSDDQRWKALSEYYRRRDKKKVMKTSNGGEK